MNKKQQVDIPLVMFSFAFFIIILGLFSRFSFQRNSNDVIKTTQVAISPAGDKLDIKLKSLDFEKPIVCDSNSASSTISAQLSGISIGITVETTLHRKKTIVQGDCVYSWIETEKVGSKQCGIGQYISIGKQLLGSNLVSLDSIGDMAKQMGKTLPENIGEILNSCKNVKNIEKQVFVIPENVEFTLQ